MHLYIHQTRIHTHPKHSSSVGAGQISNCMHLYIHQHAYIHMKNTAHPPCKALCETTHSSVLNCMHLYIHHHAYIHTQKNSTSALQGMVWDNTQFHLDREALHFFSENNPCVVRDKTLADVFFIPFRGGMFVRLPQNSRYVCACVHVGVFMRVCTYACMDVCMCVCYVCVHACMQMYAHACTCIHIYAHECTCMYMYMHIYIVGSPRGCMDMYACMHVCMYAVCSMHVCMYASIHICCMYRYEYLHSLCCKHVCIHACMHVCMYACTPNK
jgi:hypothetical protein